MEKQENGKKEFTRPFCLIFNRYKIVGNTKVLCTQLVYELLRFSNSLILKAKTPVNKNIIEYNYIYVFTFLGVFLCVCKGISCKLVFFVNLKLTPFGGREL